jgi:hypothetical protein
VGETIGRRRKAILINSYYKEEINKVILRTLLH